jgi:hypothetical protein
MISVRLSDEEYTAFRRHCHVTGARSVSDLARDAMRVLLNASSGGDGVPGHIDEFRAQMHDLDKKVEKLAAEITMIKGNGSH